ncbi:MAG: aldolase/citrate lyase family protein [Nitrososphaeria archaeon]
MFNLKNNKLRELIKQGKPTLGTHILNTWPGVVEIIGAAKEIDYIEFVGEYAPFDLFSLENIARACDLMGMSSMMKIDQQPKTFLATRALGSGIQNLLFADVRNVAEGEECIKAVKMETPEDKGVHGCNSRRSANYGLEGGSKEFVKAMNETVIAFMIEKKSAVDNLEEILSLKGIDMVQFGPCDYSISLGIAGEFNHPKVKEAELKTIKTAIKMGIRPRVELGTKFTKEEVQKYTDLGVMDFCNGTDLQILYGWIKEKMPIVRQALSGISK